MPERLDLMLGMVRPHVHAPRRVEQHCLLCQPGSQGLLYVYTAARMS